MTDKTDEALRKLEAYAIEHGVLQQRNALDLIARVRKLRAALCEITQVRPSRRTPDGNASKAHALDRIAALAREALDD
jgi:hypothetical protein